PACNWRINSHSAEGGSSYAAAQAPKAAAVLNVVAILSLSGLRRSWAPQGQSNHEARARSGLDPQVAPVFPDNLLRQRQSEAEAVLLARGDERIEQAIANLRRNSRPIVFYFNPYRFAGFRGANPD